MKTPIALTALTALLAAAPARAAEPVAPPEALLAEQTLFKELAARIAPFIVQIETVGGVQPLDSLPPRRTQQTDDAEPPRPRGRELFRDTPGASFLLADGPTTGIVWSADGLILTSSFNFVRDPAIVTVKLADGRQFRAEILGRDQVRKLTLLRIPASNLPVPEWAPPEQIRVGQWAIAVGRGFGGEFPTISVGIVSALNRMAGNALQTDAKLSPANYGGPLVDSAGRILGICVPMAQRPGELAGIELYDAGIGFAVPAWRVQEIAGDLAKGKSFARGWLGMQVDPQVRHGVRILRTADPSPLRAAGAQPGDMITRINDQPIKHFGQLVKALYMLPAGEQVRVHLLREAEEIAVDVVLARSDELGELPPEEEPFDPSAPQGEETPPPESPAD